MAFPTIPTGGRVLTTNIDGTGTRTFPDLSGLTKNSGDLLIAIIVAYESSSGAGAPSGTVFSSWGASFTEFCDQMTTNSSTMAIGAAYKISTGSETGTFTVTQAATITGGASLILLSIPGAHKTTAPEVGTIANGTGAAADPGSLDPANWGAEDTLWISVVCSGMTNAGGTWTATGTAAPTNYTDRVDTNRADDSIVGRVEGAVSFRQLNAASEDVGTAGVDITNARNSALVIAVRPDGNKTITGVAATATAAVTAPVPIINVASPVGSSTSATLDPLPKLDVTSPVSVATASVVAPVLPKSPTIISPSGDATASVVSQIPEILVTSISLSTASVVSPTVTTQVTVVAPANDSTASVVTPTITLDVVSPAAEATASIVASTPEILLTANATATASIVEPLPLITVTSVSEATASVDTPVIIVPALVNYANVLIFGN